MSKREENRLFLFGVSSDDNLCVIAIHSCLNSNYTVPINYYWYLHVLITPRYGHSKASMELVPVLVIPRYGHNKAIELY